MWCGEGAFMHLSEVKTKILQSLDSADLQAMLLKKPKKKDGKDIPEKDAENWINQTLKAFQSHVHYITNKTLKNKLQIVCMDQEEVLACCQKPLSNSKKWDPITMDGIDKALHVAKLHHF